MTDDLTNELDSSTWFINVIHHAMLLFFALS